ncbi:MAG: hypothetical protein HY866_01225 [Chloroflexi bacterium]|nr:hypothetical protein [Chloroflexota bacterium]
MIFLAYLLLAAILLGAGTLTASFLPTRGARIGLGAVVFLAVVVDSTWFAAPLVNWSPALADRAWAGALALISVSALLAATYYRRRPTLPAWTWPSQHDLAVLMVVVALFGAVVLVLPVPLDTDAQGFGQLALALRDGHDYTTLAPWFPEIDYLYSPGYIGLVAHLSARFDPGIHSVQLVLSAVIALLFVWTAYDLGHEIEGPRTGRAMLLAALIGAGLITAFMDSHYTALLALLFSLGFITFITRFLTTWRWTSVLFAAICLAGVPLSQPDVTIALMIGYAPWLIVIWLSKPRPNLSAWLILVVIIPLVALGIVAPWLTSLNDLLGSDIESPFKIASSHWRTLTIMHGGVIVILAALGAIFTLRKRHPITLWMLVWVAAIVEFSTLGLLEKNFPNQMEPLLKYDYPFSMAWHGPIIPYLILGGAGLVWLADRMGGEQFDRWAGRLAIPLSGLAMAGIAAGVWFVDPLLEQSKEQGVKVYGAFSSAADVEAMRWLRDNTPSDALILNHPGPHEGDWVPVISERETVYFRPQPFFRDTTLVEERQNRLRDFWRDPADPSNAEVLIQAGVNYVLVPQIFGDSTRFADMLRWRSPIDEAASYLESPVSAAPYLRLVHENDGAQVYEVITP